MLTTQKQVRSQFWIDHPSFDHQAREAGIRSKRQNYHCATVRCAFADYIEMLSGNGEISQELAQRVTL